MVTACTRHSQVQARPNPFMEVGGGLAVPCSWGAIGNGWLLGKGKAVLFKGSTPVGEAHCRIPHTPTQTDRVSYFGSYGRGIVSERSWERRWKWSRHTAWLAQTINKVLEQPVMIHCFIHFPVISQIPCLGNQMKLLCHRFTPSSQWFKKSERNRWRGETIKQSEPEWTLSSHVTLRLQPSYLEYTQSPQGDVVLNKHVWLLAYPSPGKRSWNLASILALWLTSTEFLSK